MEDTNKSIENLEEIINLINKELDKKDKNVSAILDLKDLLSLRNLIKEYKKLEEENIQLEACKDEVIRRYNFETIPIKKVKDIIDRIDYDIKKTKEIISKNTNIYASYRKNDYQIVRLKAMNTKSLDIKKRLQELLESEE